MFDVGFSEVLLIAVVALLVLGPERLPKAARFAGLWIRRARGQWESVRTELERELAAEELKASVARARAEAAAVARGMQDVEANVRAQGDAVGAPIRDVVTDLAAIPAAGEDHPVAAVAPGTGSPVAGTPEAPVSATEAARDAQGGRHD